MLATPEVWPQGKLAIVGPASSGKTHLAHMAAQDDALLINGATLRATQSDASLIIVDNAQAVAGQADREEALFHLHNNTLAAGGKLLILACSAPARWGITLPDLRSRMEATHVVTIAPPEQALLEALLIKQLADGQVIPKPGVTAYLATHMDRSFAAAKGIVSIMEQISRAEKAPATLALAKRALAQWTSDTSL